MAAHPPAPLLPPPFPFPPAPVWGVFQSAHVLLLLRPRKCNYTPTNPLVCWNLFHASVKGLVKQTVPRPPSRSQLPAACCVFLHSDGCTSENPIRIREPTLSFSLSRCSPANLILLPFLPDVSWLRGIDKRLCVIPRLWKSQSSLSVSFSPYVPRVQHFSLFPGAGAEQRDMYLISKWLAAGELSLYWVLQFV